MIVYEFDSEEAFLHAVRSTMQIEELNYHTPIPLEEVENLRHKDVRKLDKFFFGGAVTGILIGVFITLYPNLISYPLNIGGKPLFSWPAFLVIVFELMILFAALALVGGFFFLNKYPAFDKEVFALKDFNGHIHDHYFITSQKELQDVHAIAVHHLTDDP